MTPVIPPLRLSQRVKIQGTQEAAASEAAYALLCALEVLPLEDRQMLWQGAQITINEWLTKLAHEEAAR